MFKLYPEQQTVVNQVLKFLPQTTFQLITGEVGSGKTYMGSAVLQELLTDNVKRALVIVPKHMISKWDSVLSLALISEQLERVDVITDRFTSDTINEYDIVVYDEVHLMKSRASKFAKFISDKSKYFIGLTGSIVDKNIDEITNLTNIFSDSGEHYFRYADVTSNFNRVSFIRLYVIDFIAHGLSRETIQSMGEFDTEAPVEVHKIDIEMDDEEKAFYRFLMHRLSSLGVTESRQMTLLNAKLDRVQNMSDCFKHKGYQYFIGERLHSSTVAKDLIMTDLLKSIDESVLIYVMNDEIGRRVADANKNTTFINVRECDDVELVVNEKLLSSNVVINIDYATTGIDLHANHLIWYQTPTKLTQDVQGTGRITRLSSSSEDKHVYYLYHNNTKQEALVKKLEENRLLNNDMIKKKSQSSCQLSIPFAHLYEEEMLIDA